MSRKNILIVAILLGVAILFFVLSKVFIKPKATTNNNPVTQEVSTENTNAQEAFPLDSNTIDMLSNQASSEFDFAFGKAKEWRTDAAPMAVNIKYDGKIDRTTGKDTYIFFSPSLDQYYFTVTIDQLENETGENNFTRTIYYREDYFLPPNIIVLPIKYWTKDYLAALQKADELGGKDIRKNNKEYSVNMILSAREDRYITWDVEYTVNGTKMFSVPISANTGEELAE